MWLIIDKVVGLFKVLEFDFFFGIIFLEFFKVMVLGGVCFFLVDKWLSLVVRWFFLGECVIKCCSRWDFLCLFIVIFLLFELVFEFEVESCVFFVFFIE